MLGALFHSGLVSAVALGNIALQSSLGQPLRVVIPVALNHDETLTTSCLKLMRDSEPGTPQLLTGRVNIERIAASTRLIVTTPRAIEEPALRVSVQAGCGSTVRRDYVLLLDPQAIGSGTMVASSDPDEFKNYIGAARPAKPARRVTKVEIVPEPSVAPQPPIVPQRSVVAVVDPAPSRTEFTPIVLDPVPAARASAAAARTAKESPAAPVIAGPAPQNEPVMLTAVQPQRGFIPEAAAASLSRVSAENQNPIVASTPSSLLRAKAPAVTAEETLWTQTWPYAAVLFSIAAIMITAWAKRRRVIAPAWSAPTLSKTPTQTTAPANTFAHFGAMTEPVKIALRPIAYADDTSETTYDASLDTLLQEVEPAADVDGIDEHVIRRAWADAATDTAADIGSDSILKAIAAAERDLHISPPAPAQAAMDKALDDDLLREPKLPPSKR